jgi:hypothetical protein
LNFETGQIWDLKAGRLLTDLKGHTGAVNTLEFHPNEFLLATGSSDRWESLVLTCLFTVYLQEFKMKKNFYFIQNGQVLGLGKNGACFVQSVRPQCCQVNIIIFEKMLNLKYFKKNETHKHLKKFSHTFCIVEKVKLEMTKPKSWIIILKLFVLSIRKLINSIFIVVF